MESSRTAVLRVDTVVVVVVVEQLGLLASLHRGSSAADKAPTDHLGNNMARQDSSTALLVVTRQAALVEV